MQTNPSFLFSVGRAERFTQESGRHASSARKLVRNLLFLFVALVFTMPLASETRASEQQNTESYENIDARWLPWIGSWRLVSNAINAEEVVLKEDYLLTMRPDGKGNFITMESTRDKMVMFREKIEADGLHRSFDKDGCTGWYSYSWSDTGKRLLFNGETSCDGNLSQTISGILIIDTIGDLVDIKLLKSGGAKAITIRRYRNVENDYVSPDPAVLTKTVIDRISAGISFTIDEIIELSGKIETDALDAALVEMHNPFPVNSKQLVRLSDANVPSQIVDLVVALSFPKKFTVKRSAHAWVEISSSVRVPYYYLPMCPWYWTSSAYSLYGYRYWGWDWYRQFGWSPYSFRAFPYSDWDWDWYRQFGWSPSDFGYFPYREGFYPGSAYSFYGYRYWGWDWYRQYGWYPYIPQGGGSGHGSSGKLVEGLGYTRVYPGNSGSQKRYARPRNAQATKGSANRSSSGSSAGSTSAAGSASAAGSSYSAPSASPGGYSSGGGSTGMAQPN